MKVRKYMTKPGNVAWKISVDMKKYSKYTAKWKSELYTSMCAYANT